MKKMFFSVMALMISVMAMATEEAYVCIRLTSPSGTSSVVRLTQDNERTAAYESGYDSQKMMYQANSKSVLLYGFVGTEKCEDIVTNQIPGVKLGFVTNNVDATGYKLKFENVSGIALKLYDAVEHQIIDIVNNDEYEFNATAGRVEVENRFSIYAPYEVTLNANGLATFSATDAVSIPDGLTAYTATGLNGDVLGLAEITADQVPANTGVILYGAANADYELPIIASAAAISGDNYLKAATVWPAAAGTVYILHGNELWEYTGSDMKANKAYLQLPAGAPKRIRLAFDQATAIDNVEVEAVKAEKFVENGQIFIRRGNEVFNLQGQLVK